MSAGLEAPQPPDHIAARLPSYELAEHALKTSIVNFPTGSTFFRAAWNAASVWPASVQHTPRFGPPPELADANGQFPYHWVYTAQHVITAVWEAGFCANDATRPGTFFLSPDHEWSQWFGCLLDKVVASGAGTLDGIRYPSRKHPGHSAFAISSRAMNRLDAHRSTSTKRFKDTAEFVLLMSDHCLVKPP